ASSTHRSSCSQNHSSPRPVFAMPSAHYTASSTSEHLQYTATPQAKVIAIPPVRLHQIVRACSTPAPAPHFPPSSRLVSIRAPDYRDPHDAYSIPFQSCWCTPGGSWPHLAVAPHMASTYLHPSAWLPRCLAQQRKPNQFRTTYIPPQYLPLSLL
ncbi:unnamed protein product, partial [Ectocarpus fasciculatus]